MSLASPEPSALGSRPRRFAIAWMLAAAALSFSVGLAVAKWPEMSRVVTGLSAGCLAAAVVLGGHALFQAFGHWRLWARGWWSGARDMVPVVACTPDFRIVYANGSARDRLELYRGQYLTDGLSDVFADPVSTLRDFGLELRQSGPQGLTLKKSDRLLRVSGRALKGGFLLEFVERQKDRVVSDMAGDLVRIDTDKKGRITLLNPVARRLLNPDIRHLEDVFGFDQLTRGTLVAARTKTGRRSLAVVDIRPAPGGGRTCLFLDIIDSNAPPPLVVDHSELRRTIDALPIPILKVQPDGAIALANGPAAELLGFEDASYPALFDVIEGPGRAVSDWISEALAGHGLHRTEVVRVARQGRDVFLQIGFGRIEDKGELALLAILTDATELKTLEAQFVQSQKMQAIGQLAGGVAHDFNNLLTAISGHADLLLLRHDEGDPDYGDLVQITQNANRAAALVGQLLAFSRKQTLSPEVMDLRDTLSDLTHLLNRLVGEKVQLDLDHDPALKVVRADKRQFEQVMMNLVVNARDAMPKGGVIRIETRNIQLVAPEIRDRADVPAGDYVEVRVSDEGTGIPPEKLSKIFEPFYTSKRMGEGTGLGLSTAYGIIKQTGGFIFADSKPGEGSCFTVMLPAIQRIKADPAPPAAPSRKPGNGHGDGVVLLVEDEAPVRAFASRALRLRGYSVIEAEDAEQALDLLDDPALEIDVFVTDVIMPGMDGPTWVCKALKDRPDTRVIFVSGYAEDGLSELERNVPHSVFLPKPFSLRDLTAAVQDQLS